MKIFQKGELNLLWPFYANALISPLFFIAPAFFIPYFISLNFSMTQVGIIFAALYTSSIIFEIPTGAFADLYGRKFSSILGFLLEGLIFFFLWLANSFETVLLLFIAFGFASTLYSGAYDSWAVDLVKKENKKLQKEFFIKDRSLVAFALVFSGILGAFFVKNFGLAIIWPISAGTYFITIIFLLFGKEHKINKKKTIRSALSSTSNQTKKGINFVLGNRSVLLLMIVSFIGGISTHFLGNLSWTSLLIELKFPDHAFGYLWSYLSLIGVFAPFTLRLIKEKKERNALIMLTILSILITVPILITFYITPVLIILGAGTFLSWTISPLSKNFMHRIFPTSFRATLASIESMLLALGGIISSILTGISLDSLGARQTIFIGTIILIPQIIIYLLIKEPNSFSQPS